MRLIVGLGNPGKQYIFTRHNAGFLFVDYLVESLNLQWVKKKIGSVELYVSKGLFLREETFFVKPLTYMNLSGKGVKALLKHTHVSTSKIIVVHDEAWLSFGDIRWKWSGGAGGHNGLKSLVQELSTPDFFRLRIGISPSDEEGKAVPPRGLDSFVLSNFSKEEMEALLSCFKEGERILLNELEKTGSVFR